jgi:hypothetical protein
MAIKFLTDAIYDTGGRGKGPRFAAGTVLSIGDVASALGHEVTDVQAQDFLDRWVRRGKAMVVELQASEAGAEPVAAEVEPKPEAKPVGRGRK